MQRVVLLIAVLLIVGFILGWIFPVEGPIDYIYDNYKVNKCSIKNCPPQKVQKFTDEELDYIMEMIEEISEGEAER